MKKNISILIFLLFSLIVKTRSEEIAENINGILSDNDSIKSFQGCPDNIKCVPKIQCPAHIYMKNEEKPQNCSLPVGEPGFCCITGQNHTVFNRQKREIMGFGAYPAMQNEFVQEAQNKFASFLQQTPSSYVQMQKPDFQHHLFFHATPMDGFETVERSNAAMEQILASQIFRERQHVSVQDFQVGNVHADFIGSSLGNKCPKAMSKCTKLNSKYRSFDGTCNNPTHPRYGVAGQPMEPLLPPSYEDGIWEPRRHGVDGTRLTGAREISRILLPDIDRPHHRYNILLMQFGQFVSHDVTHSASITQANGDPVQCCSEDGSQILPPHARHYGCMPIRIEPHDEFYKKFNQGCLNFVRQSLVPNQECRVGYGKQLSKVSHYLDGSVIYGSDLKTANSLRTFHDGRLKMSKNYAKDILPLDENREHCSNIEEGNSCFLSGDGRTNQIISLVVLHIVFAREHNRIATVLSALNPYYNDEKLYQEARRIVVAEFQHIIYNEYLPIIIGPSTMKRFRLYSKHNSYSHDYDPEVNPAITNAFTGAAFRFGHSTVDGKFKLPKAHIDIPSVMFNPQKILTRDFYDDMLITLTQQPMQKFDNSITFGLTRFMFRGNNKFGLDLAALNIQRGNDQGLRPYNDYLEAAGFHRIQSFHEFHPEIADRLSKVYKHPDDIDVWIGGLIEPSLSDALVGPTFAEIIGDQFSKFRHGDRYFYENDPHINPGHFRPEQLEEIRRSTLAGILCDNLDYYSTNEMPPMAFLRADLPGNKPIRCDSSAISRINLNAWREHN